MFGKKCDRCGRKIDKDFEFCPYCGRDFRIERKMNREEDFGMLGNTDLGNIENSPNFGLPMGFNKLFNSLLKDFDKQFKEIDQQMPLDSEKERKKMNSISISITTESGKPPKIEIKGNGPELQSRIRERPVEKSEITDERAREYAKLPRKEAIAKVRRMSNRVVYEIDLPEVKTIKDIVINKLENSIEIKAFSEKTIYFKLIPVKLPILNYALKDGKLILELGEK